MKARYIIERWPHGWLFCGANGLQGIPLDALSESMRLFPKNAVMALGIVHHFRVSGRPDVCICVATESGAEKWRAEIERNLEGLAKQERWWRGTDVGTSSAAIFAVFCDERWREATQEFGRASLPSDFDDFGRCSRLLERFPEWRPELHRVAGAYPGTAWERIIPRWDDLEKATPRQQSAILAELRSGGH